MNKHSRPSRRPTTPRSAIGSIVRLRLAALAMLASGLVGCTPSATTPHAAGSPPPSSAATITAAATNATTTQATDAMPSTPKPATENASLSRRIGIFWDFFFNKPSDTVPAQPIAVQALTQADLLAAPNDSLWRLGHSTVLMKLNGKFFLTDPVFSERASPFGWLGPKRFHAPPISIEDLPQLAAVILSHDHYDHLDQAAIGRLRDKTDHFVTPLRVGDLIRDWGVPADKITQLDWWGETRRDGVRLVATPAQHFSGRTLFDSNQRLWSSWVIKTDTVSIFFSGDSGYFDGFAQIGERLGPFDLTLMETGAYDPRWPKVHMLPEQTVQAHRDLRGRWLLPIHNGTFDLAFHRWNEPLERVSEAATQLGVALTTPSFGVRVAIGQPQPFDPWWQAAGSKAATAAPAVRPAQASLELPD